MSDTLVTKPQELWEGSLTRPFRFLMVLPLHGVVGDRKRMPARCRLPGLSRRGDGGGVRRLRHADASCRLPVNAGDDWPEAGFPQASLMRNRCCRESSHVLAHTVPIGPRLWVRRTTPSPRRRRRTSSSPPCSRARVQFHRAGPQAEWRGVDPNQGPTPLDQQLSGPRSPGPAVGPRGGCDHTTQAALRNLASPRKATVEATLSAIK